jgi:hypothetical protein
MTQRCVAIFAQKTEHDSTEDLRVFSSIDEFLAEYGCGSTKEDLAMLEDALRYSHDHALGMFRLPELPDQRLFYVVGERMDEVQDLLRMAIYHRQEHHKFLNLGIPTPDLT